MQTSQNTHSSPIIHSYMYTHTFTHATTHTHTHTHTYTHQLMLFQCSSVCYCGAYCQTLKHCFFWIIWNLTQVQHILINLINKNGLKSTQSNSIITWGEYVELCERGMHHIYNRGIVFYMCVCNIVGVQRMTGNQWRVPSFTLVYLNKLKKMCEHLL